MNVAILTGGTSSERSISEQSAELVRKYLDKEKYAIRLISIEKSGWIDVDSKNRVDLNDFSLTLDGKKRHFDFVFLMIHGTPAEDGKLQGYFELMGIAHSTCDTLCSALTFDKQKCKDYLRNYDVPMASSILILKKNPVDKKKIQALGLPLFVKPNGNGSSYGVHKVIDERELYEAIEDAFRYDSEVIVESFLDGREFSCGVVKEQDKLHVFPVTEIIPKADFFTYEAKYDGASDEITPADISTTLSQQCMALSEKIYNILSCKGIVRFDYILVDNKFHFLEANTIPGMSEMSIVPQQARAYGWTITKLLDVVISDCLNDYV